MKVGLLGGSFDPVHHGHLIVATALVDALSLDHLRLVVACEQPFKHGQHAARAADRLAMVRCAVQGTDRLRAEAVELERAGPSFTIETLRILTAREPGTEWVLLLGADAAGEFSLWREPEEIRDLSTVVVFNRGGLAPAEGFDTVSVPEIDISATQIRDRVRHGRSIRYWVPDAVAEYIAMHGLYQGDAA